MPKDICTYTFFKKLAALPFVEAIYLYGSRARGDEDERSDIDLAIRCHAPADEYRLGDIIDDADTLLKIDYMTFDKNSHSAFLDHIKKYWVRLA